MIKEILNQLLGYILLGLIVCGGILLDTSGLAKAKENIIFTNPEKPGQVFTKNTEETIQGYFLSNEAVDSGQISFDGQIWRDLRIAKDTDRYNFSYKWTVAGKGKMFITVKFLNGEKEVAEGRIISEVYVPPELQEAGLFELLDEYQQKQEKEQAKLKNQTTYQPGTFFWLENFSEKTIGNFVDNKWMALLPTKMQLETMMQTVYQVYLFINKYPAGIDIFFFFTVPVMIAITIFMILFVIMEYGQLFLEYLQWKIDQTFWAKSNKMTKVYVFDIDDYSVIKYAKIIFTNSNTHQKIVLYSNEDGWLNIERLSAGEYSYEIIKQGYKNYLVRDIDDGYFMNKMIIKNNNFSIDEGEKNIALPAESEMDLERKVVFEKKRLLYPAKKFCIYNFDLMTGVATTTSLLWMIFVDKRIGIIIIAYILLNNIIFRTVIRQKEYFGQVTDKNGTSKPFLKLSMWANNVLLMNVWTDIWGKFNLDNCNVGDSDCVIKLNNNYKFIAKDGLYYGQDLKNVQQPVIIKIEK
ncbi:MAG TPA: carboxypeptidase-like regulatory domain-containing protein [bacterium]|nr:carboxypeptidase-like regulatory domain-containing protein [bacterium]HPN67226.1 carboxypeptidase-like regulatory domain-containing protein [bacterium]